LEGDAVGIHDQRYVQLVVKSWNDTEKRGIVRDLYGVEYPVSEASLTPELDKTLFPGEQLEGVIVDWDRVEGLMPVAATESRAQLARQVAALRESYRQKEIKQTADRFPFQPKYCDLANGERVMVRPLPWCKDGNKQAFEVVRSGVAKGCIKSENLFREIFEFSCPKEIEVGSVFFANAPDSTLIDAESIVVVWKRPEFRDEQKALESAGQ
jgi:hypothetical protein